ncbi:MAG: DUF4350 domain-containing protein [Streptosporangiales bacterium]|nr:DUF4350 domain-containing protein [Streptosporangiales bacterium]
MGRGDPRPDARDRTRPRRARPARPPAGPYRRRGRHRRRPQPARPRRRAARGRADLRRRLVRRTQRQPHLVRRDHPGRRARPRRQARPRHRHSGSRLHLSTSLTPSTSTAARNARPIVLFVLALVVLVTVGLVLLVGSDRSEEPLSTESAEESGTRALAQLLDDRGVGVDEVTSTREAVERAGAGTTLVVAETLFLSEESAQAVADSDADLVLLAPYHSRLAQITALVETSTAAPSDETLLAPQCDLPAATRAGAAELGGQASYRTTSGGTTCYPSGEDAAALVQVRDGDRTITVVGSAFPFQNGGLAREGNAALALNLLGQHEDLVWLLPGPDDAPSGQTGSLASLVPMPARIAAFGAIAALVLFALSRARRLGPVVTERLPVVVRATETTEGRARLYRSLRARERAADAMRRGAVSRMRPLLRLPRGSDPEAVVAAVAGRVDRDPAPVAALLFGGAPPDDATLVRLADDLDALESEVRRS